MTEWQPISTAPHHKSVIVHSAAGVFVAIKQEYYQWHWIGAEIKDGGGQANYWGTINICPTHWMPLPSPPQVQDE